MSSFFSIDVVNLPDKAVPHLSDEDTDMVASDAQRYYAVKLAKNYRFINEV
jgi:hypothetical protein